MYTPNLSSNPSNINFTYNNPNEQFKYPSHIQLQNIENKNFPDSFKPNQPLINHLQTQKQPTLHDNLKDDIFNEYIKEYHITVDSLDRNIINYPDPFKFKLTLSNSFNKNNELSPFIQKNFKNVKYIKIDSIICPIYHKLNDKTNINDPNYDENYATTYNNIQKYLKLFTMNNNSYYDDKLDKLSNNYDYEYENNYINSHKIDEYILKTMFNNPNYIPEYDNKSNKFDKKEYDDFIKYYENISTIFNKILIKNKLYVKELDENNKYYNKLYYNYMKKQFKDETEFNNFITERTDKNNDEYDETYDRNSKNFNKEQFDNLKTGTEFNIDERYELDNNEKLNNSRFILLKMNNLTNNISLGTNQNINNSNILFYPRKVYNDNFMLLKPFIKDHNIFYVNDSNLINIDNIEFELLDGQYNKIELINKDINETDNNKIQSPLNINYQIIFNIRLGIYENYLDTDKNYH